MRIAVDARPLSDQPSGVGRYLEGLLTAWRGLFPGDAFVLLSPRRVRVPEGLKDGVEVRPSPRTPGTLWLQTLAGRAAARAGADLFFGPLGVLPLAGPLPGVATVHDLTPILRPEWHTLKNRLGLRPFLGPTVACARRLAAVSENTRADLVQRFPAAGEKCVVVYNGLTPPPPAEAGPPPNEGRPYVLYLGTLEPRKNLPRLVRAMESLWDRRPDFPDLVLAGGSGWGLSGFERLLGASRHAARLRRCGYVTGKEATHLLRHARLLAYPSLYEGFGFPPLEAMAVGTPVVASSSSSLPEVVGNAGLLPDPESEIEIAAALVQAQCDEAWRALARARGLERVKQFTWTKAATRMRALFEEALS
jgi:glycosyltransferase involved in cell wall biosynthesis